VKNARKFVRFKRGYITCWIASDYQSPTDIAQLLQADGLFAYPGSFVVKDQRKVKVARVGLNLGGRLNTVYLKRYNAFSLRFKVGSLFSTSGARQALLGSILLREGGVLTPEPIAALESRCWGMLTKSHFISHEIVNGQTADTYWCECLLPLPGSEGYRRRRRFLKKLARLFRTIHERHIYHNDLKDANILVTDNGETGDAAFYLLDLEGIRKCIHLGRRRRVKNLVQLNRTLGKFLRPSQKLFFLKAYLGEAFLDNCQKMRWVADVVNKSLRLDRRKNSWSHSREKE